MIDMEKLQRYLQDKTEAEINWDEEIPPEIWDKFMEMVLKEQQKVQKNMAQRKSQ